MKKNEKTTTPFPNYPVDEFSGRFLNEDIDTPSKEEFKSHITPDPYGMSVYFNNEITNSGSEEFL